MSIKGILSSSKALTLGFALALIVGSAYPTWEALSAPALNEEYAPGEFDAPLAVLDDDFDEEDRAPRIAARKRYFAHLADGIGVDLPYTDYEGLVRYLDLNGVDYLLVRYDPTRDRPFFDRFESGDTPDFELLYSNSEAENVPLELYRVAGVSAAGSATALAQLESDKDRDR